MSAIDLKPIVEAVKRGNGRFALGRTPVPHDTQKPFSLAVGARKSVKVLGSHMIMLGLSREHLVELRDRCNQLLGD